MHLLLSTHTQATVSILPPRLSSAGINCLLQLPTMNFMTHRTGHVPNERQVAAPDVWGHPLRTGAHNGGRLGVAQALRVGRGARRR